jgi:predicted permease
LPRCLGSIIDGRRQGRANGEPGGGDGDVIEALAPVALLIGLGYALRATGFLPEASWSPVDRLVYYVLFPALLVRELAGADLHGLPVLRVAVVLLATQLAMALLAAWTSRLLQLDGPAYTSILQCVVRWNTYIALALAPAVLSAQGVPLVALAVAVMVPAANVMSVAALARHGRAGRAGPAAFARAVATNPLILACLLGIALNLAEVDLPALVREPLAILGRATLALGLLTVGAGLRPALMADRGGLVALTTAGHLLVKPAIGTGLALAAGLAGTPVEVVALACAVPTATSSYILARLLGGDAVLMAALVTTTTVAALATLPAVMALARALA